MRVGDVIIRASELREIIALREQVLIRGTARTSPIFEGDHEPDTRHIGAFAGDRCVACATLVANVYQGRKAYQLRGMAVAESHRGRGIGAALLRFCESQVDVPVIWANARIHAAAFYQRMGWRTVGDAFMIEGVGPHYRMERRLGPEVALPPQ